MEEKTLDLLHQESASLQEIYLANSNTTKGLFGRHSFCIAITPDTNRLKGFLVEPYIKLGNGNNLTSSTAELRICLRDAKVVYHTNKPSIKVTTKLLNDLNAAMLYNTTYNNKNYTVIGAINAFLTDQAKDYNLTYTPVVNFDFTQAYNYRKSGGDYKLC